MCQYEWIIGNKQKFSKNENDKAKKAYLQNLQICVYLKVVEKDEVTYSHGKLNVSQLFDWNDLVPSGCKCTHGWISFSMGF